MRTAASVARERQLTVDAAGVAFYAFNFPGAAFAAAGRTLSALGPRVYVGISESVDLYGVVGAVFLVLTRLYVVSLSLLVGVVLNAVSAGRLDRPAE